MDLDLYDIQPRKNELTVEEMIILENNEAIKKIEGDLAELMEILRIAGEHTQIQGFDLDNLTESVQQIAQSISQTTEVIASIDPQDEVKEPDLVVQEEEHPPEETAPILQKEELALDEPKSDLKENLIAIGAGAGSSLLAFGVAKGAFIAAAVTTLPATIVPIVVGGTIGVLAFVGTKFHERIADFTKGSKRDGA